MDYCWLLDAVKLNVAKKIPGGLDELNSLSNVKAEQGGFAMELENSLEDNKVYLLQINIKNKNTVPFLENNDIEPCKYIRCSCLKRDDNNLKNNMCLITILKDQRRGQEYFLFTNHNKHFFTTPMNRKLWSSFKQYKIRMKMKPLEFESTSESN